MTERLTKKTKDGKWYVSGLDEISNIYPRGYGRIQVGRTIDKLAEYENAEEDGRMVIVPPLNIDDTVYLPIDFEHKIYVGKVDGFEYAIFRKKWVVKIKPFDAGTCYEAFDDFGKTFFSDAEEAEKALKEMERRHE